MFVSILRWGDDRRKSATATVQVDERGRLVLPKGVRVYLDIEARDTVQVEVTKP
jgi:hypothetical protein